MNRNCFARLIAAMVAIAFACAAATSCSDSNSEHSVIQTIRCLDGDGNTVLRAKFYDNDTWRAWEVYGDREVEGMHGTYIGIPEVGMTITITATEYRDENGDWVDASSASSCNVSIGMDGIVSNLNDVTTWIQSFYSS